jgi:hypothetical protein
MMMRSLATLLVLLLVASFSLACAARKAAAPETIKPAETDARLVCVTARWAVWKTSKLDERTKRNRVATYDYAFYRQRLTEPQADLIHTLRAGPGGMDGTVTDDGTFLLSNTGYLSWHTPGKAPVEEPAFWKDYYLLGLYPDGALAYRIPGPLKPRTVEFIPFKDRRLDLDASVRMLTGEGSSSYWNSALGDFDPRHFVRHDNSLACLLLHKSGAKHMPEGGWKASLYVFDLNAKKHRTVPLAVGVDTLFHLMGFDGDVATTYYLAFDAKTGEVVGPRVDPHHGDATWKVFAARNRFGYFFRYRELFATDLTSKTRPAIKLSGAPSEGPVALTENGIILWNGETWATIPWLKERPGKK